MLSAPTCEHPLDLTAYENDFEDWDIVQACSDDDEPTFENPLLTSDDAYPQVPFVVLNCSSSGDATHVCIRRFVCCKVLGVGSGGSVYETECGHAVKVVHSVYAVDEEADVLCNLHHPGLLHALHHGTMVLMTLDGKPVSFSYFVFPMAIGSLVMPRKMLQAIPFATKIGWIKQLYYALCALQDHGYLHGDLHPKNVLWWDQATVKLCDFGLSFKHSANPTNVDDRVGEHYTCTFPFCSPLALLANEVHKAGMKPEDAQEFAAYVESVSGVSSPQRDQRKCDMFAFGQLISYLLFAGEHFLRGDLNVAVENILCEFVDFVAEPDEYFECWWAYVSTKYDLEKSCKLYGNLNVTVNDIRNVICGLTQLRESFRFSLDDLECVACW